MKSIKIRMMSVSFAFVSLLMLGCEETSSTPALESPSSSSSSSDETVLGAGSGVTTDEREVPQSEEPDSSNPTGDSVSRPIASPHPVENPGQEPSLPTQPDPNLNPIIREALRLTGGSYELTSTQRKQVDRATDPPKVADHLEERVLSWRRLGAYKLNIELRDFSPTDALKALNFSSTQKGWGDDPSKIVMTLESYFRSYNDPMFIFELGKRVARIHQENNDLSYFYGQELQAINNSRFFKSFHELTQEQLDNPIVIEIRRMTGESYKFSSDQLNQIRRAKDPHQVAEWLEERVHNWRRLVAFKFDIKQTHYSVADALRAQNLSFASRGFRNDDNDPSKIAISRDSIFRSHNDFTIPFGFGYKLESGEWN